MKKLSLSPLFVVLSFLIHFSQALAREEVVIVQSVTSSGRSFALQLGLVDGIRENQESLFSTKDASVVAISTVVNRYYSVWEVKNKAGSLPFKKGESVIYSRSIRGIWDYLSKQQAEIYLKKQQQQKQHQQKKMGWILRGHYSYALSQSTTQVFPRRYLARTGFQASTLLSRRFHHHSEYALGLRMDREKSKLKDPTLLVPTLRVLMLFEVNYYFDPYNSQNGLYIGSGLGYGYSRTNINEFRSSGECFIFPILRIGKLNRLSPHYTLIFEGTVESISSDESFSNHNSQLTHIINSKFGIGLRF